MPPNTPRQTPIQRRLIGGMLLNTISVLLITCFVLLIYEVHRYRESVVRSVATIADIIAENSGAALLYDDQKVAQELVDGLHFQPEITAAGIFDNDGKPFAIYRRNGITPYFPAATTRASKSVGPGMFSVQTPVNQGERRVGTLMVMGDLGGIYHRLAVYGLIIAAVFGGSVLVALTLSNFFQRRISEPLIQLAETAREVSERKDYSLRLKLSGNDEFGDVTNAFNGMIEEIQISQKALQESEERFRALADNIPQLAWIATGFDALTWFNQRWYDFTGTNWEDTQRQGWGHWCHPEHLTRVREKMKWCFENGEVWSDTFPLRNRNGGYRWFLSTAAPIRNKKGNVGLWFGTNTDITDQREAEQKALAASRAKDEFLAALSHELRTPLNPVLLVSSDSASNTALSPEVRADFELVRKNIELEARLIDDLLDLTSITRGKLVLNRQQVDLHQVLKDALATVGKEMTTKQIELVLALEAAPMILEGDPVRLQQVCWNILKNAAKFTPSGGRIIVRTRRYDSPAQVRIEISDTGIGLTSSEMERIFEAFRQGEHALGTGSHQFGGLGLGLTISRMLVELHGGKITATSEGRHRGALFTIELPLADAPTPAREAPAGGNAGGPSQPSVAKERVLLVEDHDETRHSLERLLERRRYPVVSAANIAEARAIAAEQTFDVVISDIGLPDGLGYELMQELRERYGLLGVALTGFGMEADVQRSRETGFVVHLTKPATMQRLEDALNVVAAARAARVKPAAV